MSIELLLRLACLLSSSVISDTESVNPLSYLCCVSGKFISVMILSLFDVAFPFVALYPVWMYGSCLFTLQHCRGLLWGVYAL